MDLHFPHPGDFSGEGVDVTGNLSFLHSGRPNMDDGHYFARRILNCSARNRALKRAPN